MPEKYHCYLNRNFPRVIIIAACFLLSGFIYNSLNAMSWPSGDAVLFRNFGVNENGKPVLGMIFSGGTDILAAESGEVIFSRAKNDSASRLPSPLGAWTAIDHGDGLISVYSRYNDPDNISDYNGIYSDGSPRSPLNPLTYIEKNQPIAVSGVSGWSSRDGFYFMLYDRRERRWINPAMIINPAQDTRPPQIVSVNFRSGQGQIVPVNNLTQGRYTVVVTAAGGSPLAVPLAQAGQYAPHVILCSVNGAEVGSLIFESVSARDGTLMVSRNGLIPANLIYAHPPSFEAAEVFLTRGQVTLEVIVQDINGVTRNTVSRFTVN